MERKRGGAAAVLIIPIMIASVEFNNIARNPRFEQIHTVDVVGLIGCGICIGVAMTGLIFMFRGNRA
jgi:hypothetical protein